MKNSMLPITMSSSTFSDLKRDMTTIINKADTGTVSVWIRITVDDTPVTVESDYRTAKVPTFKHKVAYKVPVEENTDGEFGGEYELVVDGSSVGLKPINGEQMSLFEEEDDEDEEDE